MSNWRERAEQERLRLAREQEAAQQSADQAKKNREALIHENLGLFDQLGIRRILGEIQRDIWRGQGTIDEDVVVTGEGYGQGRERGLIIIKDLGAYRRDSTERSMNKGFGIKLCTLSGTTLEVRVKTEWVRKKVYGQYEIVVGRSMEGEPSKLTLKGWHDGIVGEKIVDASLVSRVSHRLSTSLIYFVDPNRYLLVIGRKQTEFSTPDIDVLAKFVDQAFLDYATQTSGKIPDFAALKREAEMDLSTIQRNIGRLTKDVPEVTPGMIRRD
jgi:hypothetical protein